MLVADNFLERPEFGSSLPAAPCQSCCLQGLATGPAYLSREFSKYFDDLSFGEYIRKLRIEKAIQLLHAQKYSLTEIAYLTGFSDQSHFTRIFKKHTGKNPSAYKKSLPKSKANTKS